MKKNISVIKFLLIFVLVFFSFSVKAYAKQVNVYFFYGETCPHCKEAFNYLNKIKKRYNLNIIRYEVWNHEENVATRNKIADYLDMNLTGVPCVIINNKPIMGFTSGFTEESYRYNILKASKDNFIDDIENIIEGNNNISTTTSKKNISNKEKEGRYEVFNFNIADMNVFFSTALLGISNNFHFVIVWTIIFVLSIILFIKDKNKRNYFYIIYIFFSLLFFLLLTINNYNIENLVNMIPIIKLLLALFAIVFAIIKISDVILYDMISIEDLKNNRIKTFLYKNKNTFFFLLIILVAFMINVLIVTIFSDNISLLNDILEYKKIEQSNYIVYKMIYSLFSKLFVLGAIIIMIIINKNNFIMIKNHKKINMCTGLFLLIIGLVLIINSKILIF